MHAPGKQLTRILLAGLAVSSLGLAVGCDSDSGKADKEVDIAIQTAETKAAAGTPDGLAAAIAELEKAAGNSVASLPSQAQAKAILAQAELTAANQLLRKVDAGEVAIAGKLDEIGILGDRIEAGNLLNTAYAKREPTAERAAVQKQLDEARGGGDKAEWISQDKEKSSIPTLSAIQQTISRLEGDISTSENQLKSLTEQRSDLLANADKLMIDSEALKGEESVKMYKDGSEARRKAGELGVQIDNINAALVPMKADLVVAQGQQTVVQAAIAGFEAKLRQIDETWAEVQKQSDAQLATSKGVFDGSTEGVATIASLSREIGALLEENRKNRDAAEQNLNNAIKHFDDAATAATKLGRELQTAMGETRDAVMRDSRSSPWVLLQKVIAPSNYLLQKGNAQLQLAQMYSDRAGGVAARENLARTLEPVLSRAKLSMPSELSDSSLAQEQTTARGLADATFAAAVETLSTLSQSSASDTTRAACQVSLMLANYAWSESAASAGQTDNAKNHLNEAIRAREAAKQMNVAFPVLPEDIAPAPTAPPTSPSETPAAAS